MQFHTHFLSEHTVGGRHTDFEIHIVHQELVDGVPNGQLGVIGIFIESTATMQDQLMESYITELEAVAASCVPERRALRGEETSEQRRLQLPDTNVADPYDIVPLNSDYYTYLGSLTTPPCSEGTKEVGRTVGGRRDTPTERTTPCRMALRASAAVWSRLNGFWTSASAAAAAAAATATTTTTTTTTTCLTRLPSLPDRELVRDEHPQLRDHQRK
eukprot:scaffold602_cov298-Pinguiococcus_pyrenoidosus.AAC.35